MKQEQRGAGPVDPALAHRVEALVDEAVALAAKGSYRDATARAEQARSLDPDNRAARELIESYRRLAEGEDARRRRRRSIAAAAAAIEEMIEADRLEEAATAVEALSLQYGVEAPVDELRGRIAVARADERFDELDAAIDAIRRPAGSRGGGSTDPLDAVGTLAAEIEDHLRSGRLDQATGRLAALGALPGSEERHHKLRNRIEEARHFADEHRREEEILIATAAIEERLRRGAIDDAAQRLQALASQHGSSAPVAELQERLEEARAAQTAAGIAASGPGSGAGGIEAPLEDAIGDAAVADPPETTAGGRGKWIAVAAAVALLLGAGGWWISQRSPAPGAPVAAVEPAATAPLVQGDSVVPEATVVEAGSTENTVTGAPGAPAPAVGPAPQASGASLPSTDGAPVADTVGNTAPAADAQVANTSGAESAAARTDSPAAPNDIAQPVEETGTAELPADATVRAGEPASGAPPPVSGATTPEAPTADTGTAASDTEAGGRTEVVVEAVRTGAPASVPVAQERSEPEPPDAQPPMAISAPPTTLQSSGETPAAAAGQSASTGGAPAAQVAEGRAPAGPPLLECGEPGVVCVKPLRVPQPIYPPVARQRRLTANVVVFALVNETGRVIETRVEESDAMRFFKDAAEEAAQRSVFEPASRSGVPGRSWARLAFVFSPR